MKIVIRAGGVGSRLWPVSRSTKPKQFHALVSQKTMLQEAVERVDGIAASDDIYISTGAQTSNLVKEQAPELKTIVEPVRRDTAAAIGLESIIIAHDDPEAVVASLGSDHSVARTEEFQRMLNIAEEFVEKYPDYIIPLGVKPTRPDDGFGYIQYGEVLDKHEGKNLWKVERFMEKPSVEEAEQFLTQGNFLWNANMFVWKVSTILALYQEHLPEMYSLLMRIAEAIGTDEYETVLADVYPQMEKVAVDYAIIEKTDNIAVLSADIGWNDIGDWGRLKDELASSEADNVVLGTEEHLSIKTRNTLVYTDTPQKMVVTVGVENVVVVDTGDALLICDKEQAGKVKDVVSKLEERKKHHLL